MDAVRDVSVHQENSARVWNPAAASRRRLTSSTTNCTKSSFPVGDDDVLDSIRWTFPWPSRLARRPIPLQAGTSCRHPVAKALSGVGEVAMPSQRRRAVLLGIVGAQPVHVQRGKLPHEFGVPMPERRNDGRREAVRPS
jgi:hypothetical protein